MEDYKKKYEEALESCKKAFNFNNLAYSHEEIRQRLESIFPELKESEDEKIRKELIRAFKEIVNTSYHDIYRNGITYGQVIAWLEKQGEQKKDFNYPKFNFNDVLALQCCIGTVKEIQEEKDLYEQLQSLHDRVHDAYWLEKQGEQKPQGKLALEVWKDMRFEVYQQASGNRHEPNYSDDSTKMFSLTDIDEIFEKVAEKQGEQKPAWSEEDEHMLKSIIATCKLAEQDRDSSPARHLFEMQVNWLKSLKERMKGEKS